MGARRRPPARPGSRPGGGDGAEGGRPGPEGGGRRRRGGQGPGCAGAQGGHGGPKRRGGGPWGRRGGGARIEPRHPPANHAADSRTVGQDVHQEAVAGAGAARRPPEEPVLIAHSPPSGPPVPPPAELDRFLRYSAEPRKLIHSLNLCVHSPLAPPASSPCANGCGETKKMWGRGRGGARRSPHQLGPPAPSAGAAPTGGPRRRRRQRGRGDPAAGPRGPRPPRR